MISQFKQTLKRLTAVRLDNERHGVHLSHQHRLKRKIILISCLSILLPALLLLMFLGEDSQPVSGDELAIYQEFEEGKQYFEDNIYQNKPSLAEVSLTTISNQQDDLTQEQQAISQKFVQQKTQLLVPEDNNSKPQQMAPKDKTESVVQAKTIPVDYQIDYQKEDVVIKSGDTLAAIFKRLGLKPQQLYQLTQTDSFGKQLKDIHIGEQLTFFIDESAQLQQLVWKKSLLESIQFKRIQDSANYEAKRNLLEVEKRPKVVNVRIQNSLFFDATQNGLNDNLTMRIAQLFAWDIDFALDIRAGDQFTILYQEHFLHGKKIADGDILAAEFINQSQSYYAVYYDQDEKLKGYYDLQGFSKRKAFIRTPVAFSRISSRFSLGRKHPILNKVRAHHGVDYAAPRGTPVKSAGDGKVVFKGRRGGYGRVIKIRHGAKYVTVYAHLDSYRRGIKNGSHVRQGQVIGYVGSSGLATGPHLHYEFQVNGVHRNPLTIAFPKVDPLPKQKMPNFKLLAQQYMQQLSVGPTHVALSDTTP